MYKYIKGSSKVIEIKNIEVYGLEIDQDDPNYVVGVLVVNDMEFPFDYRIDDGSLDIHQYSEPAWFTGASYEKPLPKEIFNDENWPIIDETIMSAVEDYLQD